METLLREEGRFTSPRMVEDDLEDIISIQIPKELRSRKSQSQISYLNNHSQTQLPLPPSTPPPNGSSRARSSSASSKTGKRPRGAASPSGSDVERVRRKSSPVSTVRKATVPAPFALSTSNSSRANNMSQDSLARKSPSPTPTPSGSPAMSKSSPKISVKKSATPRPRNFSSPKATRTQTLKPDDDEGEKTAPWNTPDAAPPNVFVDPLTGKIQNQGRRQDMVLPVVARKMEAERLRQAMEDQEAGLVNGWGTDGLPRSMSGRTDLQLQQPTTPDPVSEPKPKPELKIVEEPKRVVQPTPAPIEEPVEYENVRPPPQEAQIEPRKSKSTTSAPKVTSHYEPTPQPWDNPQVINQYPPSNSRPNVQDEDQIKKGGCCGCIIA